MAERVPRPNPIQFILIVLTMLLVPSARAAVAIDPGTGNCIDTEKNQSLSPSSPQCASLVQNAKQKKIADCFAAGGQCANSSCMQEAEIRSACCNGAQSGSQSLCTPESGTPGPKKVPVGGKPAPAPSAPTPGGGPASPSPAAKAPADPSGGGGDPSPDKDPATESAKGDGNPSDKGTSPSGVSPSSPNNQAALQACYDAADDAAAACGSAGGGGFSAGSGGINSYSSTLYGAAGSAANQNIQRALYCTNRSRNCAAQCYGVDAGTASECEGYESRTQALGRQTQEALTAQQGAFNSGGSSSANLNARQIEGCDFNPTSPECRALEESRKRGTGDAGFDKKQMDDPDFNVSANGVGTQSNSAFTGNEQGLDAIKNAPPSGTVPNNSGGPIPGQGASSSAGFDNRRPTGPGAPGYTTDVLQGFQGGGYSNSPGSSGIGGSSRPTVGRWRVPANQAGQAPAQVGLDLKKYLPGGARQNNRNLGGFIPYSTEINPASVNIWSRISDRIVEKCRLGELLDCR